MRTAILPLALLACTLFACTPAMYRQEADDQVYGILEKVNAKVTGNATVFNLDRPVDTLRARLLTSTEEEPVQLSMLQALDVAAENSFTFQRQKESLYLAALNLTRQQNDFALRWGGGGSANISGTGDEDVDVNFSGDLSASARSPSGALIVFDFVNNLLRSVVSGGGFDGSSILRLTFTQPLLQGAGEAIVREPLTQSERDLIYRMREFEQFRRGEAVNIISQYLGVVQQMRNLRNLDADLANRQSNYNRAEALFAAGRGKLDDVDRADTDLLRSQNSIVNERARLQTSLDGFKQLLGLPTDSVIELDITELDRLEALGVTEVALEEERAIELALTRRYDYQTALDQVDDAARRVMVSEDALKSILDFRSVISVPTDDPDESLSFDWSNVSWRAGFDLDLAIDKLPERNAYRTALINLDVAIRNREQAQDRIKAEIRRDLRDIRARLDNYVINVRSLELARRRVDSTRELYAANRVLQIDVNDAQDSLIASQLTLVGSLVDYYVTRLDLIVDLEALMLEPRGLRFDPGLPLPEGPLLSSPSYPEISATPQPPEDDVEDPEQRMP